MKTLITTALGVALTMSSGVTNAQYYNDGHQVVYQNGTYYEVQPDGRYCTANDQYDTRNGRVYDKHNNAAGPLIGALIGGVLGNQIGHGGGRAAATLGGAVAGGVVGNKVQDGHHAEGALNRCFWPNGNRYNYDNRRNYDRRWNDQQRYTQCMERYEQYYWRQSNPYGRDPNWARRQANQKCRTTW